MFFVHVLFALFFLLCLQGKAQVFSLEDKKVTSTSPVQHELTHRNELSICTCCTEWPCGLLIIKRLQMPPYLFLWMLKIENKHENTFLSKWVSNKGSPWKLQMKECANKEDKEHIPPGSRKLYFHFYPQHTVNSGHTHMLCYQLTAVVL